MKLMPGERAWAPEDKDSLLCVLKQGQPPPTNLFQFLSMQEDLLLRLVEEADEADVELEEQRLSDNLPFEVRMILPGRPLQSLDGIRTLLNAQVDAGNSLEDWRRKAAETLANPHKMASPEESKAMAENLDLAQYLESRVLY